MTRMIKVAFNKMEQNVHGDVTDVLFELFSR